MKKWHWGGPLRLPWIFFDSKGLSSSASSSSKRRHLSFKRNGEKTTSRPFRCLQKKAENEPIFVGRFFALRWLTGELPARLSSGSVILVNWYGIPPRAVTVTTRIITFLVGNPNLNLYLPLASWEGG